MKIKLKFIGLGINNNYQAKIKIYDNNNCLIIDDYTYNGQLVVNVKHNKVYRLEARFYNEVIITSIYSNKYEYCYIFNHALYVPRVTLSLIDYYYNLPIEKGEIILWQRQ